METIISRSIFSPATGFIRRGGFDWTCNPYVGCTFGCTYCYAAFLPQNRRPIEEWGRWLQVKTNAVELAQKKAPKLTGQSIYLSSVTDPYLPAERTLKLTRGILEALIPAQPRLLVQTRGPLLTRDIELFKQFRKIRINMSIPTDGEEIRRAFEPKAPPLDERWAAIRSAKAAGLPIGICVTPMLPLKDPARFCEQLCDFDPDVLVVQDFHDSKGAFGANTGAAARGLLEEWGWSMEEYKNVYDELRDRRSVLEGEEGFFPP